MQILSHFFYFFLMTIKNAQFSRKSTKSLAKSRKNHGMSYHLLTRISTGMSHHIKYFISIREEFVGVWFLSSYVYAASSWKALCCGGNGWKVTKNETNLRCGCVSRWNATQTPTSMEVSMQVPCNVTGCVMPFIASLSSFFAAFEFIDDDVMSVSLQIHLEKKKI